MPMKASKLIQKDEMLATFYALRAGLSLIAEETDKIKAVEKELDGLIQRKKSGDHTCAYDDEIKECKKQYEHLNSNMSESSRISANLTAAEQRLMAVESHKAESGWAIAPGCATSLVCPFIGAILMTLAGANYLDSQMLYVFGLIIGILGMVFLPFVVGFLCRRSKTEKEKSEMRAKYQAEIRIAKKDLEKAKATEELEKQRLSERIQELRNERENCTEALLSEIRDVENRLNGEIVPDAVSAAQVVKKSMLEMSEGIIQEEDWKNLDLLIFYLETGRAESLKEALQLADVQRQTNQIANAIFVAQEYIVTAVNSGFDKMERTITAGFNRLSYQIHVNHNEAMNTMLNSFANLENTMKAGNAETNAKISKLDATLKNEGERIANAEKLNAALLQKANESSEQLVRELQYNQRYWVC